MQKIKGGICAPQGFLCAGVSCGIKKSGRPDLAVIFSGVKANAAGVFTSNAVKAAPVIFTMGQLEEGIAQAIVANSGNANCCTGSKGLKDAEFMAEVAASSLKIDKNHVLVASTGTIGKLLPMKKIEAGIKDAAKNLKPDSSLAAKAILTTDKVQKEIAVRMMIDGKAVTIGGICKGSGMINPCMATMLAFLTTDAKVNPKLLKKLLLSATTDSFNMITVDNDQSTNDMLLILANGLSRAEIKEGAPSYKIFEKALKNVCIYLAKEIARDGEGATKLVEVKVINAKTIEDARIAAKTIVGSALFKAAIFGEDANWGRIMAALGYSGVFMKQRKIQAYIGKYQVVKNGRGMKTDPGLAKEMKKKEIKILVDVGLGTGSATSWGCDLSFDYVRINARYRT